MHRQVLRLVLKEFLGVLNSRFPPSGQPTLHDLEARAVLLVDALTPEAAPSFGDAEHMSTRGVVSALEWLLKSLASAYTGDSWAQLAVHALRLIALESVPQILQNLADAHLNHDRNKTGAAQKGVAST